MQNEANQSRRLIAIPTTDTPGISTAVTDSMMIRECHRGDSLKSTILIPWYTCFHSKLSEQTSKCSAHAKVFSVGPGTNRPSHRQTQLYKSISLPFRFLFLDLTIAYSTHIPDNAICSYDATCALQSGSHQVHHIGQGAILLREVQLQLIFDPTLAYVDAQDKSCANKFESNVCNRYRFICPQFFDHCSYTS